MKNLKIDHSKNTIPSDRRRGGFSVTAIQTGQLFRFPGNTQIYEFVCMNFIDGIPVIYCWNGAGKAYAGRGVYLTDLILVTEK